VVFKISPSENFSPPPSTPTTTTGPVRTLCDVSALALDLNFEDQVRSRHHVQVQSPISTARFNYIKGQLNLANLGTPSLKSKAYYSKAYKPY